MGYCKWIRICSRQHMAFYHRKRSARKTILLGDIAWYASWIANTTQRWTSLRNPTKHLSYIPQYIIQGDGVGLLGGWGWVTFTEYTVYATCPHLYRHASSIVLIESLFLVAITRNKLHWKYVKMSSAKMAAILYMPQCVNELATTPTQSVVAFMVYSRLAHSQWEMSLQSNAVPHWLGANLESTLCLVIRHHHDKWKRCNHFNYIIIWLKWHLDT